MKNLTKTTLVVLAFALAPLSAYAQDTTTTPATTDTTTTPATTDTTNSAATPATTDTTTNNNRGFDYGWLGLLGLAGLAGLNRKQPPVVHVDPQRR